MTNDPNERRLVVLRLVSLSLAFDDARFFGAAIFTDANDPDGACATVLIDRAEEEPWFRLTTTDPAGDAPSEAAIVEADRLMRFILTHYRNASAEPDPPHRRADPHPGPARTLTTSWRYRR